MAAQTPTQIIQYYANLLIYQYVTQSAAYATVFADVTPICMPEGFSAPLTDANGLFLTDASGTQLYAYASVYGPIPGPLLPLSLQNAFTLGTAIGVQLDTLALYIGGSRTNLQLNGLYLTFTDAQFTAYLTILAVRNSLGSDMNSIENFFNTYFPNDFVVYDYEDMHMSFIYKLANGVNPVAEALITSGNLPVPIAVGATLVPNPTPKLFFAFRTYSAVAQAGTSGFNFYSSSQIGTFLSYAAVIPV